MPVPHDTHILIVEDSLTQAVQLQFLLEKHGFQVTTAHNGRQGLECARLRKPSIIISDIVMPTMDGLQFIRLLRAEKGLDAIPVIFYTATYTDPGQLDTQTAAIAWGDGLTETLNLAAGLSSFDFTHVYAADGTYTVTVTLTDDDGGVDVAVFTVTVTATQAGYHIWLPIIHEIGSVVP